MIGIMKRLNNISRCQSMYRVKKVHAENLCSNHYAFVMVICNQPGRSQEELSRELCLDKSTVARVIAHLEKHGYVTRTPNESDRRQYLVHPTEKMLDVYPKVRSVNWDWNQRIEAGISPGELEVFYKVLLQMEKSAKDIMEELEGTT